MHLYVSMVGWLVTLKDAVFCGFKICQNVACIDVLANVVLI